MVICGHVMWLWQDRSMLYMICLYAFGRCCYTSMSCSLDRRGVFCIWYSYMRAWHVALACHGTGKFTHDKENRPKKSSFSVLFCVYIYVFPRGHELTCGQTEKFILNKDNYSDCYPAVVFLQFTSINWHIFSLRRATACGRKQNRGACSDEKQWLSLHFCHAEIYWLRWSYFWNWKRSLCITIIQSLSISSIRFINSKYFCEFFFCILHIVLLQII